MPAPVLLATVLCLRVSLAKLEMPTPELSDTVQLVSSRVPRLTMPPPGSSLPFRMVRFASVTVAPEPIRKIRKAGSVLRRRMTIPVPGPVIVSVFSTWSVPPPAAGLARVMGPVRPEAKLISVLPEALIASRSVHCAALQVPSPGSARLLTTLRLAVWLKAGPPSPAGGVGAVGGWPSPQAASTRSESRSGSRRGCCIGTSSPGDWDGLSRAMVLGQQLARRVLWKPPLPGAGLYVTAQWWRPPVKPKSSGAFAPSRARTTQTPSFQIRQLGGREALRGVWRSDVQC